MSYLIFKGEVVLGQKDVKLKRGTTSPAKQFLVPDICEDNRLQGGGGGGGGEGGAGGGGGRGGKGRGRGDRGEEAAEYASKEVLGEELTSLGADAVLCKAVGRPWVRWICVSHKGFNAFVSL